MLVVGSAGGWWYFGRSADKQNNEVPAYRYQLVERGSIISTLEGVGAVQPVNSYTVKALVTGEVLSAPFSEGDVIAAGQLLYQIDAGRAQNNYTLAKVGGSPGRRGQIERDRSGGWSGGENPLCQG